MEHSRPLNLLRAEAGRWPRDTVFLAALAVTLAATAALTLFAVLVSAGAIGSGAGGVQIDTDTLLGAQSTNEDLASLLRSSLVLLLPIAAVVIGAHFAGSELSSGVLLTIAVAARKLRLLFAIRIGLLALVLALLAALSTVIVCAVSGFALSAGTDVEHLSAWAQLGPLMAGASVQTLAIGLLTFSLAALTRRWVPVVVASIVYIVALEPVVQGFVRDDIVWLPWTATSSLLASGADWMPVLPTAAATAALAVLAILSLRRDRAFR